MTILTPKQTDLGWRERQGSGIAHHWGTRTDMKTAVSGCGQVASVDRLKAPNEAFECYVCWLFLDIRKAKDNRRESKGNV